MIHGKQIAILVLILCLALGLCLSGCGKVTTEQAQQYLDGENDTSTENIDEDIVVEEEGDAGNNAANNGAASGEKQNGSAAAAAASGSSGGSSGSSGSSGGSSGGSGGSSGSSGGSSGGSSSSSSGGSSGGSSSGGGSSASSSMTCTISIDCKTILYNMEKLDSAKKNYVPADGVILKATTVTFKKGDSVFDILQKVTKDNGIQMEFAGRSSYGGSYVEGIANLYEFDCGNESGWQYCVNDWYPNYSCSNYIVSSGDVIKWRYTCEVGKDL